MQTALDKFHRQAKQQGYRARSAFKLLDVAAAFHVLDGVRAAVDLCAAPGSWSQVLAERLPDARALVAVDLQDIAPIPGVRLVKGDITEVATPRATVALLGGERCDVVVCDGAPDGPPPCD